MSAQDQIDEKIARIQSELAPKFKYVEQFRQQFFKDTLIHAALIAGVIGAICFSGFMVVASLVGAAGLFYLAYRQRQYVQKVKEEAVKPMAELLDLKYIPTGSREILHQADGANLLPSYTKAKTEDSFMGVVGETRFEFTEAHLERVVRHGDKKKTETVFRGGIMRFSLPYRVEEEILIVTDNGLLNKVEGAMRSISGMENISLEDPSFEKFYEVYGRDQLEARRVLTPIFMSVLFNLKERFDAKISGKGALSSLMKASCDIQMMFKGNTLIMTLDYNGDYFEPGLMFNKLDSDWVVDMVEDFALMRFVASSLKLQDHNYTHTQVSE